MAIKHLETAALKFLDYLTQLHFKYKLRDIGRGTFSVVYQHPTMKNVVVKVAALNRYGRKSSANRWLQWCKKHPNKYVPKIYGLKPLAVEEGGYVCFMEKLTKASRDTLQKWMNDNSLQDLFVPSFADRQFYWHLNRDKLPKVKDADLRKVLTVALELSKKTSLDFNPANIMLRGTQVVFVDPVV